MKRLIAVYGSFRKGCSLSHYLDYLRKHGTSEDTEISGLRMFVVGQVPAAVITNDLLDKTVVELIECNLSDEDWDYLRELLDQVEGVHNGLYQRSYVDTPRGRSLIYTWAGEEPDAPVITDWVKWLERPLEERSSLMAAYTHMDNMIIIK